jgi:uncharacterized protein (UPF0332 family)
LQNEYCLGVFLMPFDWAEYLVLAKRLAKESDDASHRTAISRAYYSVYHAALAFLEESDNFQAPTEGNIHQKLWNEFRRNGGQTHRAVGTKGDRLRLNRSDADYKAEIGNLQSLLDDSCANVKAILYYLDQLNKARTGSSSSIN